MGFVSDAVIDAGGQVTGIVPRAMVDAGGEGDKTLEKDDHGAPVVLDDSKENVQTVRSLTLYNTACD